MSADDEETRAKEYRRMMLARDRNDATAARALRGDEAAAKAVREEWEPITNRHQPPEDHDVR